MILQVFRVLSECRKIFIFLVLLVCVKSNASFDFSPIIAKMEPAGAKATMTFTVTNYKDTKMPVQISIVARDPDVNGKEDLKETDAVSEMFRIFPSQVILNAKETRSVRVTYMGSPKIKEELPFRIIAEEIPVDVNDPNKVYTKAVARVNIATKYVGSLYVTPSGVKPIIEYEVKPDEKNPKNLVFTISNKGTAHQVIKKPVVRLKSITGGKEVVVEGPELKDMVNQNILPGKVRRFTFLWPKDLPPGPVKGSVDLPKE